MFTVDISLSQLQELLDEVRTAGGNAIRFTVYDSSDEVPPSISTSGIIRPGRELASGQSTVFPADLV